MATSYFGTPLFCCAIQYLCVLPFILLCCQHTHLHLASMKHVSCNSVAPTALWVQMAGIAQSMGKLKGGLHRWHRSIGDAADASEATVRQMLRSHGTTSDCFAALEVS